MRLHTIPEALKSCVETFISSQTSSVSEFELIEHLQAQSVLPDKRVSTDQDFLFTVHFVLFHVLYQLQQQYWSDQSAHLMIGPLAIQKLPYTTGTDELASQDSLTSYYLDIANLTTSSEEIDGMLNRFWEKYLAADERVQALSVFELSEPVDYATIKNTYRGLVNIHHPDKGGDKHTFQQVQKAMDVLSRYYAA